MSGICAVASFDGSPIPPADIDAMMERGAHRGRDGSGVWRTSRVALGQLSTWVVPEDRGQATPLVRHAMAIAVDGRIDNEPELRPVLVRMGYLAGAEAVSTLELVLAAYRCWGSDAPRRLIGDFAFVVWDGLQGRLIAARDPMGMRPLYHHLGAGRRPVLASEIWQLLAVGGVPCTVDERGIAATLAGPYLPADATLYDGIGQVAPGHLLTIGPDGVRSTRYWRPDPNDLLDDPDPTDGVDRFRDTFRRAVADRTRALRPVGLSLSGGMDSGSVAAAAASGGKLRAYSWSVSDGDDERDLSDALATSLGIEARHVAVERPWPLGQPDAGPDREDAFHWPYQALQDRVVELAASDGVGVMLYGDRGDELLGDWIYDEVGMLRAGRLRAAVGELRHAQRGDGLAVLRAVRDVLPGWVGGGVAATRDVARRRRPGSRRLPPWLPPNLVRRTGLDDLVQAQLARPSFDGAARSARFQRVFMSQGVRAATLAGRRHAVHGLGAADPYADRRLVELVLSLPQWLVQTRSRPKALLREAMRGVMPERARLRAAKRVPNALYELGMREREVDTARSLLTGSRAAAHGWLDEAAARAAYERYVATGTSAHDVWWVITVESWLRRWWS